jgi:hypothetical protein
VAATMVFFFFFFFFFRFGRKTRRRQKNSLSLSSALKRYAFGEMQLEIGRDEDAPQNTPRLFPNQKLNS